MTYIAPIEGEALLLLRKKEIRKIEEMRREQENTMQTLIATHYSDMEAQQRQAIIDMEELAQIINFDNVAVTETERAEAMTAEDINPLTYGMEEINDILNDQRTEEQLEQDKANAVAPTPEVGDYGYTELGQDAEDVVFELVPEAEPEETPVEEPAPEETPVAADTPAEEDVGAPATDEWSFIDSLEASDGAATTPTPVVNLSTEEDRENRPTTFKERWENWKRKRAEKKAQKAEEKRRRQEEKKAQKERLKKLEEENKAAAAASFAPKKSTNPYTPTAQEILAPQNNPAPERTAPATPDVQINTSGGTSGGAARPRTFIPRSYTPISITPDNVHDVIGDKKKKK